MRPLTESQAAVLEALRKHCRQAAILYRESCPHLYREDVKKLGMGDRASVFGMGGLTCRVGYMTGMSAAKVLRTFKALKARNLVICEEKRGYLCALYWWPVGLAAELYAELKPTTTGEGGE